MSRFCLYLITALSSLTSELVLAHGDFSHDLVSGNAMHILFGHGVFAFLLLVAVALTLGVGFVDGVNKSAAHTEIQKKKPD